jgi:glycosyltransferase involved in cell wall biosynthesis
MTNEPLISIIIPTRNRKEFVVSCIQSALNQTYKNIEIVISDNNSIDDTKEAISKFTDPRIKYYNTEKSVSLTENWTNAFKHLKGEYFVRLDDDNLFFSTYVADSYKTMANDKLDLLISNPLISYPNRKYGILFEDNDSVIPLNKFQLAYLDYFTMTDSNYFMYKTSIVKEIMGAETPYITSLPDRYMNYNIAKNIKSKQLNIALTTKLVGLTRFDYDRQSLNFHQLNWVNYKNMLKHKSDQSLKDCHYNFAMHRVLCLHHFLECKTDPQLKAFFNTNITAIQLLPSFMIFGAISEIQKLKSIKEILLLLYYYVIAAFPLLLNPEKKVEKKSSLSLLKSLTKKVIKLLLNKAQAQEVKINHETSAPKTEAVILEIIEKGHVVKPNTLKILNKNLNEELSQINEWTKI